MSTITKTDMNTMIDAWKAKQAQMEYLRSCDHWKQRLLDEEEAQFALATPWPKVSELFSIRPGELTIWAGDSGAGKSLLVGQVIAWLLAYNESAMIASMEMSPVETIRRMIQQCAGHRRPAREWIEQWVDWMKLNLWIYDRTDTVDAQHILDAVGASADQLGVKHIVIDSLTLCKLPVDGPGYLSAQTAFVDGLRQMAKDLGIHIHLVAHTRKPEGSKRARPSKYDIRGASQITDMAHNVLIVSRNKDKDEAVRKQDVGMELTDGERQLLEEPDTWLKVEKQRATGSEPLFALWFDREGNRFLAGPGQRPNWPAPWKR